MKIVHEKNCNWEKSNCEYKNTHEYCPHPEHLCNCKITQVEEISEQIEVFMDEDANYCVIVGTDNRGIAEKALRENEDMWYGKDHEEEPIPIEDFSLADIYYGKSKQGEEESYYWGDNPKEFFEGDYETEKGFVASLD